MSINRDRYEELCVRLKRQTQRKLRIARATNVKNFQTIHPYYVRFVGACRKLYGTATYYPTQEATEYLCVARLMRLKERNMVTQAKADYLHRLITRNLDKAKKEIFSIKLWSKLND